MNTMLLSINWNPNPELFNLFGISIRYYGLLWAVGIFFAYVVVHYQYRDKKIEEKKFDPLFFYCFFGILIGGGLGFYFTRRKFMKDLKENPPINEKMIRAMYMQMGRKPSETQIKQIMKSMEQYK